jgi:hypothetical protein
LPARAGRWMRAPALNGAAWNYFETATAAAREAGDSCLLAFAGGSRHTCCSTSATPPKRSTRSARIGYKKQCTPKGRLVLPVNTSVDKSNSLLIFDESGGTPFIFYAIRYWEGFLRRLGVKKEFSRVLAVSSITSLPLVLLAIRQWPYRPLSAFWAVWLALCDSLIILLSWRVMGCFHGDQIACN